MALPASVEVVDSHTEGEPTRVVVGGWDQVAGTTMAERCEQLRRRHDELRRAVVGEPRGHGAMVGALLTPPVERGSHAGVVFFDNGGYLGMCGHGTIGVVRTLAFLGRLPVTRPVPGGGDGGHRGGRAERADQSHGSDHRERGERGERGDHHERGERDEHHERGERGQGGQGGERAGERGAAAGVIRIDTPAGTVEAEMHLPAGDGASGPAGGNAAPGERLAGAAGAVDEERAAAPATGAASDGTVGEGAVTVVNVPARCHARDVAIDVPGMGRVLGDVAYGGNWFYIVRIESLAGMAFNLHHLGALTDFTTRIRQALVAAGITGQDGAEIDHIEVVGPPSGPHADSRNFVLCPGGAYDRSPCGTGTSAMLAVLHQRGQLALGRPWRQEGIAGGLFTAWLTRDGDRLVPHIRGRAYITGRATLYFEAQDPFREGFPEP